MKFVKRNPLFFAFFFPALADGILTLIGQDASYWSGGRVNEASPAYYFLRASPWFFVAGAIIWFVFWYWLFKKLKEPINLFLTILFIAGHSWGSSSWIWKVMRDIKFYNQFDQVSVMLAWGVVIVYFSVIALLATFSLRIYFHQKN